MHKVRFFPTIWVKHMSLCFTHLLFWVWSLTSLHAQPIQWVRQTQPSELPESVKIWKGSRVSPALEIWALEIDLSDTTIAVRPYLDERMLVPEFSRQKGALAAINGGFFGGASSFSAIVVPEGVLAPNISSVTRNGLSYPVLRGMFSLDTGYTPAIDWIYHYGNQKDDIYRFETPLPYTNNDPFPKSAPSKASGNVMSNLLTGIGGGPVLVKNGRLEVTYNQEIMWGSGVGLNNRDARSAVGFTADRRVFLVTADGRQTQSEGISLPELGEVFISLGCIEALNLDGGGSAGLAVSGSFLNSPSELRKVPSILAVTSRKALVPGSKAFYEKVIDTQDSTTLIKGAWVESANAGYYAPSKALICKKGDGTQCVEYYITPPKDTLVQIYGWWVSSANRATDTPIRIKHSKGMTTVRVDQTKNGSSWQYLGEYSFRGDGSDVISVSNACTNGEYVVADAFKLLSFGKPDQMETTTLNEKASDVYGDVIITPNPASEMVTIRIQNDDFPLKNLVIFTQSGLELERYDLKENPGVMSEVTVDTSCMPVGMYFLGCTVANKTLIKPFMVAR